MDSPVQSEEVRAKSNRTLIIGAMMAVILCCCFAVAAVAGFFILSEADTSEAPQQPVEDFAAPSDSAASLPPSGGLANEVLKNDVWDLMTLAASSVGCQRPSGAGLEIKVLQQPESGGVWVEKWPVRCASGAVNEFEVEFVPEDTGVVFNIRLIP